MNRHFLTRRRFVTAVIALTEGAGSSTESGLFPLSLAWAESGTAVLDQAVTDVAAGATGHR